jgi:hypothetical protein
MFRTSTPPIEGSLVGIAMDDEGVEIVKPSTAEDST